MIILDKLLNNIGIDKILHFFISSWLVLSVYMMSKNLLLALCTVVVVGIIKETIDIWDSGFNKWDILADVLGILSALIIIILS